MNINLKNKIFFFKKLLRNIFILNKTLIFKISKKFLKIFLKRVKHNLKKDIVSYRLYNDFYYQIEGFNLDKEYPSLSEKLIQSPAKVLFKGKIYDLTAPGVYRFYRLNDISEQSFEDYPVDNASE